MQPVLAVGLELLRHIHIRTFKDSLFNGYNTNIRIMSVENERPVEVNDYLDWPLCIRLIVHSVDYF